LLYIENCLGLPFYFATNFNHLLGGLTIRLYGILGVDGFGREVMPVAKDMINGIYGSKGSKLVFVDKEPFEINVINGIEVISEDEFIKHPATEKYFNIAIADYQIRERVSNKIEALGIKPFQIIAKNTFVGDNNDIGEGAILCPFATITSDAKIGKYFHANIYSYVAHDCIVGDYVTFAPSVHCNGRVVVEDYAYIGTGVVIKQGNHNEPIIIGKGAVVGMGAVVTKNVAPYTTVIGNPARPMNK
jgi:sugar O-acyltransferase (sialic acid O-acetyltransferase NeuD family)